jgi:hypothetical protein
MDKQKLTILDVAHCSPRRLASVWWRSNTKPLECGFVFGFAK